MVAARGLLGDSDTRSHASEELAFDYPGDWRELEGVEFPLAEEAGESKVGEDTVGLDLDSWVTVFTQPVPFEVTPANVSDLVAPAR